MTADSRQRRTGDDNLEIVEALLPLHWVEAGRTWQSKALVGLKWREEEEEGEGEEEEEELPLVKLGYGILHHYHPCTAHPWAHCASTAPRSRAASAMETFKQQDQDPAREEAAITSGPFRPSLHRRNPRASENTTERDPMEILR